MLYKKNNQVVYACLYRVIWCVKYVRPVLTNGIDVRLKELLNEVCQQKEISLVKVRIEPSIVDLIIDIPPQHGVHIAVKQIKRYLSHYLRQEFPELKKRLPTLWSNAYFITTCGRLAAEDYMTMQEFLQSQRQHRGKKNTDKE